MKENSQEIVNDVTAVEIELYGKGKGIVNRNGNNGKNAFMAAARSSGNFDYTEDCFNGNKNLSFSKAQVIEVADVDENGNIKYDAQNLPITHVIRTPIISANTMRHSICGETECGFVPLEDMTPEVRVHFMSQPKNIIRGWVYPGKASRKSWASVSDMIVRPIGHVLDKKMLEHENDNPIAMSKPVSTLEFKRRGGADPTYVVSETMGDAEYIGRVYVNVPELQFLPEDPALGTSCLVCDEIEVPTLNDTLARKELIEKKDAAYKLRDSNNDIPILGVKLTNDTVVSMIKDFARNLLDYEIFRHDADFKSVAVKLTLHTSDPGVTKTFYKNYARGIDEFDNINFTVFEKYIECDYASAHQSSKELKASIDARKTADAAAATSADADGSDKSDGKTDAKKGKKSKKEKKGNAAETVNA